MAQRRDNEQGRSSEEFGGLAQKGGQHAAQTPGSASNLATHFKGIDFPCSKQELLRHVEQTNAPDEVRQMVRNLPENQRFGSMADVMAAWGRETR